MTKRVFKFNKKEGENRNTHLTQSIFYNLCLLHVSMTQARALESHKLPHFGIVGTGSCCGRGQITSGLQHSKRSGVTSSYATITRKITPLNMNFDENMKKLSSIHHKFVAIIDNNQKGNNMRYQRNWSSNKFVKVTGRMFKECHLFTFPNNYPTSWTNKRV